jgi:hypothetical protein
MYVYIILRKFTTFLHSLRKVGFFFCTMMHEKTEKTAKNRPRGHFQKKREKNLIPLANKRSYPYFVSLSLKVPRFPLLHLQTARRFQHMGKMEFTVTLTLTLILSRNPTLRDYAYAIGRILLRNYEEKNHKKLGTSSFKQSLLSINT